MSCINLLGAKWIRLEIEHKIACSNWSKYFKMDQTDNWRNTSYRSLRAAVLPEDFDNQARASFYRIGG